VLVARIVPRDGLHQPLVEALGIRDLVEVERQVDAGRDLPREVARGRHHHVVSRGAREHPRLEHVVRVVDVVDDPDAGLRGKALDGVGRDIVRPVVDVDDLLGEGRSRQHRGERRERDLPHE
jgi:hypothetical protein